MDWPHDPDGEQGSEGGRQYGHAVIAKKVDEEGDFPLDRDSFVSEYGDDPIRIDHETVVPLRRSSTTSKRSRSTTSSRCTKQSAGRCAAAGCGSTRVPTSSAGHDSHTAGDPTYFLRSTLY